MLTQDLLRERPSPPQVGQAFQLHVTKRHSIDKPQLAILCEHLAEVDSLGEAIERNPDDLKLRSLRLRITTQVSRLSAQFGLSPADRMRLKIEPKQEDDHNPIDDIIAKMGGRN